MNFELSEEQEEIRGAVREFAEKEFTPELAREHDRREEFPHELYRKAAELGFIGMHFEEEYSGQGLGLMETVLTVEELCRADSTLGTAIMIGAFGSDMVDMFGTEEQKAKYLPKVASGEWIASGAFTEPGRGSDITMVDTAAARAGDEYVINGTKTMISNAPIADFAVVLCQTKPGVEHRGESLFVVDKGAEGFEATKMEGKLGIRASVIGEYSFDDVRVPSGALVGVENMGFYHSLEFLDVGRVAVAAQTVGMAQGALERAVRYAKERVQFNRPISDFQAIQHKLADMATQIEAARLMTYKAAWHIDQGRIVPLWTCMAKNFATSAAGRTIYEALQVFGGYGYLAEYDIERYYRDVRVTEIYEGTTEIQKNMVARFLLRG
ncbi:acyl-CoA dehydrogenase [miscellaneous Crenarchaeota group-15 archaeon DG-45]|uniref:Acyl-CoA dehydrogenase n=1 Tax=miscellaneous Crenarchaeota group-15 archaeon DG-45 TaxID=1685127 RepID=A0A0M0BRG3_9ARCH|nr:MAG: acyl-CoA dehydrogenase [miscellaneous Crenarchaeota group-15 archaeon DG-45]